MSNFRMPPREKIHEALTAIIDQRVIIDDKNNSAEISSSNNTKKYIVEWNDNVYSANDSATYWQGYPGYTVIAVLLMQGKINYNQSILEYFKNICWKEINVKYKNDYAKAVEEVYQDLKEKGIDTDMIDQEINQIYESLKNLNIFINRSKHMPPK